MNKLAAILLWPAFALEAQTVDTIVERNIEARGGAKRLEALMTQSMDGSLSLAPDPALTFHAEMKRPGKIRQEVATRQGQFTQVSDGLVGWTLRPDQPPEAMPNSQVNDLRGSADMEGPLFHYKEKGHRVELAGKEPVEGREAYKLVITMKDGTRRTDFIDAKTYLEVKWEGVVGGEKMESYFRDYRKVDGLAYAFKIDTTGTSFKQTLEFKQILVNVDLPDSRFTKP